jgi:hypothetical protein
VTAPHDIPTASGLVEAVREFLERDVMPVVDGRVQFHVRVAVNALGMVERELELGPGQAAAHAEGLARLGMASEADLAAAIGDGRIPDEQLVEVAAFVRDTVRAKLEVANPRYLQGSRPPKE